jgi:hypothetical protein
MPKDMSVVMESVRQQLKNNNESEDSSTVNESESTQSMEASGEKHERYLEKPNGMENTFGPHGTASNGEIHVPACLTGSFQVPQTPNDIAFKPVDQTFGPGPVTTHQASTNKTFYAPSVAKGEQNGNLVPHQNGNNITFHAPNLEQNGNFTALSAYHQNGENQTFFDPELQAPNAYNATFYDPNMGPREPNGNLPLSRVLDLDLDVVSGFQFDFDHKVSREADGSLVIHDLKAPEVPVERNELIENFLTVFVKEKNPGVRSGVLKAIESIVSTNEALVKFLIREDFCKALDEDLTSNLTSKKREFDPRDCIIFGSRLKARIEKAATREEEKTMVQRIFQNSSYQLWYFSGISGNL